MAPTTNLSLTFLAVPTGMPIPGEHLAVKDVSFDISAQPPADGLTLEILYASFDPYLRGMMREPDPNSYPRGLQLGSPLSTLCIAQVRSSETADFKKGDHVVGFLPVQQYTSLSGEEVKGRRLRILDVENGPKDIRDFLGALGAPGLSAYSSLYEIGKPKKGGTIFISSAAGAVGQIVGQLAKHEGMKVVGSAGSDEKVMFCIEKLGFDGAWNYKKEKTGDALNRLCPEGLDIYYDNVGGEQLDAALERMKNFGRIVECGMIGDYNAKDPSERYGIKNLINVISKRLTLRGFLVMDEEMMKWFPEFQKNMTAWLKDGSFKAQTHETVGMENAAEACVGVLKGENFGKAVLKIRV